VGVAPPFRPTILLRAIVGPNGGLGLRGFLQTKIVTIQVEKSAESEKKDLYYGNYRFRWYSW